ncbi:MAG: hypothetical protein MK100_09250, partial [Phycisphaerales bacterium]|nr:hypothetical protein [Phycisphaerales bacterium]
ARDYLPSDAVPPLEWKWIDALIHDGIGVLDACPKGNQGIMWTSDTNTLMVLGRPAVGRRGQQWPVNTWDMDLEDPEHNIFPDAVDYIYEAVLSPDETVFATATNKGATLRDARTMEVIHNWQFEDESGGAVAFTPDGNLLVCGDGGGAIHICDIDSGETVATWMAQERRIMAIAISSDGKWLAVSGYTSEIQVWSLDTQTLITTLPLEQPTNTLTFSPNGNLLASGGWTTTIKLWACADWSLACELEGHTDYVRELTFSPDGTRLVSCSNDQTVRIWLPESCENAAVLRDSEAPVASITFNKDGNRIASCGKSPFARIWSTYTLEDEQWQVDPGDLEKVAFDPAGAWMVRATSGGEFNTSRLRFWDMTSNERLGVIDHPIDRGISTMAISLDGREIAIGGTLSGSAVSLIDAWTGAPLGDIGEVTVVRKAIAPDAEEAQEDVDYLVSTRSGAHVGGIAYAHNGRWMAIGRGETASIWDRNTRRRLLLLEGLDDKVNSLAFSPDDTMLATASGDDAIRLWSSTTGELIWSAPVRIGSQGDLIKWSPDGRIIYAGSRDGYCRSFDSMTGEVLDTWETGDEYMRDLMITEDGLRVITVTSDNTARIWNTQTGETMAVIGGPTSPELVSVNGLPDGSVAIGGRGTIDFLWLKGAGERALLREAEAERTEELRPMVEAWFGDEPRTPQDISMWLEELAQQMSAEEFVTLRRLVLSHQLLSNSRNSG